jgi:hypothetical protein
MSERTEEERPDEESLDDLEVTDDDAEEVKGGVSKSGPIDKSQP